MQGDELVNISEAIITGNLSGTRQLKNVGNTCYLNTLLQMWSHNQNIVLSLAPEAAKSIKDMNEHETGE